MKAENERGRRKGKRKEASRREAETNMEKPTASSLSPLSVDGAPK